MYFSHRCKNLTYLCGTANHPVPCKPVYGQEQKFKEIQVYLLPSYCVCTKTMFISKEATGMESSNVYSSSWCKPLTYLCGTANDHVSSNPV